MVGTVIAVISSICTTVIAGFLLYLLQKSDKEKEELKKQREEESERHKREEAEWKKHITSLTIQLARIQMCEYHDKYFVEQHNIPTYAYDNWTRMYQDYKALGGNGMITHMNDDIETLIMKNK